MPNLPLSPVTAASALRARVRAWREDGLRVGFVPTMGALHEGHISLIRIAKAHCDRVAASIFVNPAQFAENEDFGSYPRTFVDDAEKLAAAKCDLIFAPDKARMYPDGFATSVSVGGPAEGLESASRPHFFGGVATVVAKLLNLVRPDAAVFGEKDYQQLLVVKRLVADLDMDIDIIPGPIVRESDGLAMSSRNAYLSPGERARAAQLFAVLTEFKAALESGASRREAEAAARTAAESGFDGVDYIEARCAETLAELPEGPVDRPARALGAVRLGETRLIDNLAAGPA